MEPVAVGARVRIKCSDICSCREQKWVPRAAVGWGWCVFGAEKRDEPTKGKGKDGGWGWEGPGRAGRKRVWRREPDEWISKGKGLHGVCICHLQPLPSHFLPFPISHVHTCKCMQGNRSSKSCCPISLG